jgi:hypothetical protein
VPIRIRPPDMDIASLQLADPCRLAETRILFGGCLIPDETTFMRVLSGPIETLVRHKERRMDDPLLQRETRR